MQMGRVIKAYAIYDRPFWRDKGWNGVVASPGETFGVCFDNSPYDGSRGILTGFSLANEAEKHWEKPESERKEAFVRYLVSVFGPEAANPSYIDQSYTTEPYTQGCYAGMWPANSMRELAPALREPCGRIHWAGTETSPRWNGYMEGAVLSGIRVAGELLAR
jgi:monoamine oxidase